MRSIYDSTTNKSRSGNSGHNLRSMVTSPRQIQALRFIATFALITVKAADRSINFNFVISKSDSGYF